MVYSILEGRYSCHILQCLKNFTYITADGKPINGLEWITYEIVVGTATKYGRWELLRVHDKSSEFITVAFTWSLLLFPELIHKLHSHFKATFDDNSKVPYELININSSDLPTKFIDYVNKHTIRDYECEYV